MQVALPAEHASAYQAGSIPSNAAGPSSFTAPSNFTGANAIASDSPDQFQGSAPVMTFLDMYTGQPWGRYVVSESVTVPKYEYREVKERVYVPTWVQEPKATTLTQYDPIVSYQLRPRSVPSMNPFYPPQQIVEYVPIVQYQPRNVQTTQMTQYQKYEERDVSRMVPVLVNATEQRSRFVDRPLSANPNAPISSSNLVQYSANIAQANRTSARYPTRSIDYPSQTVYGAPVYGNTPSALAWSTPKTMIPPPMTVPASYASSSTPVAGQYVAGQYNVAAGYPNNSMAPAAAPNQISSAPIVPIPQTTTGLPPAYAGAGSPLPTYAAAPAGTPPYGIAYGQPQYGQPQYGQPQYGAPPFGTQGPTMTGYPPSPYYANAYNPNSYYPSWLTSQGSLFSTNWFTQRGGTASMTTTGGYPYTGYPPGAYPQPSGTVPGYNSPTNYTVPQLASNNLGYSSNSPNFWGRTTPPISSPAGTPGLSPTYPPTTPYPPTGYPPAGAYPPAAQPSYGPPSYSQPGYGQPSYGGPASPPYGYSTTANYRDPYQTGMPPTVMR